MNRVYLLLFVLVVVSLSLAVPPAEGAEKSPATAAPIEKAAPQAAVKSPVEKAVPQEREAPEKKATLTLKPGEKNTFEIDLQNSVPVRGIQFTVIGLKMTEVRTTSRTAGFLAKFNEETGIVILVSTAADEIAPGTGPVLEILGEKVPDTEVSLSKIMIADRDRKLIE